MLSDRLPAMSEEKPPRPARCPPPPDSESGDDSSADESERIPPPAPARAPPDSSLYSIESPSSDGSGAGPASPDVSRTGLKVLFLSSDTGGGHRASAESLARQFELLYPGSTYSLLDVVAEHGVQPYSSLVSWYSHLSSHPAQWKLVYGVSNSRAFEMMADVHLKVMCERATRKRIVSYDPDVVVSVHPLMCNVPALACQKIERRTGRHIPIFTVVTDLGSAHCLWFANAVDRVFVASDAVADLARQRGKVPDEKLRKIGLPIRHDFAVQAERLGERTSEAGRAYQKRMRRDLGLPCVDRATILVMGGGEGVGSLSDIVNHLYVELVNRGIDALVLVVCGRNEKLRTNLARRDWDAVLDTHRRIREGGARLIGNLAFDFREMKDICRPGTAVQGGCIEGRVTTHIRRILSVGALENAVTTPLPESGGSSLASSTEGGSASSPVPLNMDDEVRGDADAVDECPAAAWKEPLSTAAAALAPASSMDGTPAAASDVDISPVPGDVAVYPLGFVSRMAEHMVAADLLITKAGPGTIAEAASLSLPVLLTSFLPGQEEGNVDFVIEGGFGAFRPAESDPAGVAEQAAEWLLDGERMAELSRRAGEQGAPHAAEDIVRSIGEEALRWRGVNSERAAQRKAEEESAGEKVGYLRRVLSSVSSSGAAD